MGELVGRVTRSVGAPGMGLSLDAPSANAIARNQFVGTKANGTVVSTEASVREAQRAVERSLGGASLKWRRVEMSGEIESYEGRETEFYPGDYGRLLEGGAWWRADQGILTYPAGAESLLRRWASPIDRGVTRALQATPADQPSSVSVANAGRSAVRFSSADTEYMDTNLSEGVPMGIFVVGTWRSAGRDQVMIQSANFSFSVTAAGNFQVVNGATTIPGPAATAGAPFVLHGLWPIVGAGTPTFYLNGVSFGSSVDRPVPAQITISDAVDAWHEDLQDILVVPRELGEPAADYYVQYAIRRYQITP